MKKFIYLFAMLMMVSCGSSFEDEAKERFEGTLEKHKEVASVTDMKTTCSSDSLVVLDMVMHVGSKSKKCQYIYYKDTKRDKKYEYLGDATVEGMTIAALLGSSDKTVMKMRNSGKSEDDIRSMVSYIVYGDLLKEKGRPVHNK